MKPSVTNENSKPMAYWGGKLTAARLEGGTPSAYRIMEKLNGRLVLQGAYKWSQGDMGGHEWRDIEAVKEQP